MKNTLTVAALVAIVASVAFGQTPPVTPPPPAGHGQIGMGFQGGTLNVQSTIGKPYSAEQVTEHTQTLADGTHITQKPRTEKLYRDSQGRTRRERPIFAPPKLEAELPPIVEITDPVEGYKYTLDTQNRVAHRQKLNVRTPSAATPIQAAPRTVTPKPQTVHREGMTTTFEPLGTEQIEGVTAEGVRSTTVIEVGAQGNDAPMTTTQEHWYSPQVAHDVLTKTTDPRNGDITIRLTNIMVAEPDPTLFQVPAGYEIVDETGHFEIKYTYTTPPVIQQP